MQQQHRGLEMILSTQARCGGEASRLGSNGFTTFTPHRTPSRTPNSILVHRDHAHYEGQSFNRISHAFGRYGRVPESTAVLYLLWTGDMMEISGRGATDRAELRLPDEHDGDYGYDVKDCRSLELSPDSLVRTCSRQETSMCAVQRSKRVHYLVT